MAKLPLVTREQLPSEALPVYDRIGATRGSVLNVFRSLLNSPKAADAVAPLGEYLRYHSSIDPAARETAILSVARETGTKYEWAQHESEARRAGVSEAVIESIRSGRGPMGIPAKEGVFVQAARELVRDGTMTDRTFQAIEHLLGPEQTIDLIVLVGYYSLLGMVLKTLDVELDEGLEPPQFD